MQRYCRSSRTLLLLCKWDLIKAVDWCGSKFWWNMQSYLNLHLQTVFYPRDSLHFIHTCCFFTLFIKCLAHFLCCSLKQSSKNCLLFLTASCSGLFFSLQPTQWQFPGCPITWVQTMRMCTFPWRKSSPNRPKLWLSNVQTLHSDHPQCHLFISSFILWKLINGLINPSLASA